MRTNFDDLFNNVFGLSIPNKPLLSNFNLNQFPTNFMRTDVIEKDDSYELTIDLPGFKKEDVKIELEDNNLVVTASVSSESEKKDGQYLSHERYEGTQMRRYGLPDGVTEEDIKASFKDGVLIITMPKVEAPKPDKKSIDIE